VPKEHSFKKTARDITYQGWTLLGVKNCICKTYATGLFIRQHSSCTTPCPPFYLYNQKRQRTDLEYNLPQLNCAASLPTK